MDFLIGALKNAMRKRLRTILTIGGIAIGVMSVILISSIGDIGKYMVNSELNSMGISGVCLRTTGEIGKTLNTNELEVIKASADVEQASPLISKIIDISVRQAAGQAVVWGVDSNVQEIITMTLLHGRLLNSNDISAKKQVCVVDESFAKKHYFRSNIVGKTIKLRLDTAYENFSVVGVVSSGGNLLQTIMGEVVPTFLYSPYTTVVKLSQTSGFSQIVAKIDEASDDTAVQAGLVNKLNMALHTTDGVRSENLNNQKDKLNSVLNIITVALSAIGGISLLVAGLSIMTVMLVTVSERTREIGIKKSIGAGFFIIMTEFLCEALLLSLIGSIVGCGVGLLLSFFACLILKMPFIINPSAVIFCIVFSIAIGILFGVYPATKAARLKPVDALRHE